MDKVLKDFYEEKKRKHLEYLRLYKNNDEEVREIQKEINKIKQPLCDLQRMNLLLGKCKNGDEGAINDIIDDLYRYYLKLESIIDLCFDYKEHVFNYYKNGSVIKSENREYSFCDIERFLKWYIGWSFDDDNEKSINIDINIDIIDKIKDEKKAYDYFINIQKEYIESILNQLDQIINDSINKDGIKVKTLKKIYDSLKYYRPIDFDKVPQIKQKLKELDGKLKNYYNRNGHWYEKNEPLVLIEISPSDYEELCKKFPPYLMEIEGFVRETYKNGYEKGHKNGYDEGYKEGYDEGYKDGYDVGY